MKKYNITANSRFHRCFIDRKLSVFEMMDYFAAQGFDGIDFNMECLVESGDRWEYDMAAYREYAAKLGLVVNFGHLPFHRELCRGADGKPDKAAFKEFMLRSIDAAAILGLERAVIHPTNPKGHEADKDYCFAQNVEYLSPFMERAAKRGVLLLVENMPNGQPAGMPQRYCSEPGDIAALADHFGCGNCWDVGHGNIGGFNQREAINLLGKRLKGLHIQDNTGRGDDHLIPFFGTTDWQSVMDGLWDVDYDGNFNFECRTFHMPEAASAAVGQHLLTVAHVLLDMMENGK